jgi:hypothetical protein
MIVNVRNNTTTNAAAITTTTTTTDTLLENSLLLTMHGQRIVSCLKMITYMNIICLLL